MFSMSVCLCVPVSHQGAVEIIVNVKYVSLFVCTCFSSGGGSISQVAVEPGSERAVSSECDLKVTQALLSFDT